MKKSYFIEQQIPQYLRDQYPLFVSFLKSYYDFLDRSEDEFVSVKIKNPGKNYTDQTILKIHVLDITPTSSTYGQYLLDTRPTTLIPVIKNGRFEKVIVKNSKGVKYKKEELPVITIVSSTGTEAILEPVILHDIGNIYATTQQIPYIRDVDVANDLFKSYLYNELIPTVPVTLYSDDLNNISIEKEKFVKFIKQIYNSKGIEAVFSFIYKILYNSTVNFYYPKTDILRVSDGVWIKNYWLVITPEPDISVSSLIGHKIISDSGTTAIIAKIEEHPTLSGKWKILLRERTGNFAASDSLYEFNFKFQFGTLLGEIHSIIDEDGYWLNDNGHLDSRKKIQDDYYYQEFSYELQSEFNIMEFSFVLTELLHPAGFKYFIKILLELISDKTESIMATLLYNDMIFPDIEVVSGEDAVLQSRPLGMSLADIYIKEFPDPLDFTIIDVTVDNLTPSTPTDTFRIYSLLPNNFIYDHSVMYGYSIKLDLDIENIQYRTIIKSFLDESTNLNNVQINSAITPPLSSCIATVYPGYYPASVSGANIGLSPYDPYYFATENNTVDSERRFLIGYTMYILHGDAAGEKRKIVGYNGTTKTVVLESPFTGTVNTNSIYRIVKDLGGSEYYGAKVTEVNVIKGGSGYSATPSVLIDPPISGTSPTFSVTVSSGVITNITITAQGTGYYYETPKCIIQDATGSGCVFELVMDFNKNDPLEFLMNKSKIQGTSFDVPDLQNYYTQAQIHVYSENGFITSTSIINEGNGYWFTPRIYQTVGDGKGGKIYPIISNLKINSLIISNYGNEYNYDPIFVVDSPCPSLGHPIIQGNYAGIILAKREKTFYLLDRNSSLTNTEDVSVFESTIPNSSISNIARFSTKYLQIKYSHNTEIEVINA